MRGSSTISAATAPSTGSAGATSRCCIAGIRSATRSRPGCSPRGSPAGSRTGARLARILSSPTSSPRSASSPVRTTYTKRPSSTRCCRRRCSTSRARRQTRQSARCGEQLEVSARALPRDHGDGKKIRKAFYVLHNLGALGQRHATLAGLVEELLAQRVGTYRTVLEEHHDELTDPRSHDEVVRSPTGWLPRSWRTGPSGSSGATAPRSRSRGCSRGRGWARSHWAARPPTARSACAPTTRRGWDCRWRCSRRSSSCETKDFANVFRDFTAVDVETTDHDIASAELVEIAAVRVRDGMIVDEHRTLVQPRGRIAPGAMKTHGLSAADVESRAVRSTRCGRASGSSAAVTCSWRTTGISSTFPSCAHGCAGTELCTYDTLPLARDLQPGSAKLVDLARRFGIEPGRRIARSTIRGHSRMSASRCDDMKRRRRAQDGAREPARPPRHRPAALAGRSGSGGRAVAPALSSVRLRPIQRLSGALRDGACPRRRRFAAHSPPGHRVARRRQADGARARGEDRRRAVSGGDGPNAVAAGSVCRRRAARSGGALPRACRALGSDGIDPDRSRVNLLTLHSTKGLEFSRVYVVRRRGCAASAETRRRGVRRRRISRRRGDCFTSG